MNVIFAVANTYSHICCMQNVVCTPLPYVKYLSHSTTILRRWHGDLKFLRAPWDRTKILENIVNNLTFSIIWRCHGAPTTTVAFPRSAHGVPPRSHGVLAGDWRSARGVFVACKELSLRIDGVHTARMAHPMSFYGVFTECIRAFILCNEF